MRYNLDIGIVAAREGVSGANPELISDDQGNRVAYQVCVGINAKDPRIWSEALSAQSTGVSQKISDCDTQFKVGIEMG